ncbi:DUF192 domain-containing protein [Natrononativus amylolyticus]|uniref:DUF192 domain-containing protein n=1 Tax=Natrononativus amylolyticus TaxID=2963434 RepID=UPI0020CBBEF0|nr:DUF192 domain-containing protein [Natrononativus amylolyticus]
MRLRHEPVDGTADVLATDVEFADSLWSQTRGLMFRESFPPGAALAFPFGRAKTRDVHMLFVRFPIDVVWAVGEVVQRVERLRPWRGYARERADLIVELPAGAAADVSEGDRVVLESPP